MDTKLKRYNIWFKLLAFVVACLIMSQMIWLVLTTCLFSGSLLSRSPFRLNEAFTASDYTQTQSFSYQLYRARDYLYTIYNLKSEDSIQNATYTSEQIKSRAYSIYVDPYFSGFEEAVAPPTNDLNPTPMPIPEDNTVTNIYGADTNGFESYISKLEVYRGTNEYAWEHYWFNHKEEFTKMAIEEIRAEELNSFREAQNELRKMENIYYFIDTGSFVFTNTTAASVKDFESYPYFDIQPQINSAVAFDSAYINSKNEELRVFSSEVRRITVHFCLLLTLLLICVVYLVYATGRKTSEKKIYHPAIDRLYNEFTLALIVFFSSVFAGMLTNYFSFGSAYRLLTVLLTLTTTPALVCFLMLVRHIKSKTLLKHTLIYSILRWLYRMLRRFGKGVQEIFTSGPLMGKTVFAIIAFGLLTMIPFVGFITVPLAVWLTMKKVRMFNKLKLGAESVKNGNYHDTIDTQSKGEFKELGDVIVSLAEGLNDEVERRMKSERLKTELISNVSHDIRTPLTSVITYVDLLKNEETNNENMKNYIDVIDKKAARLKVLIDDLFEASKASSGSVPVFWETLDITALMTQGLGELDDKLKASGLDFRVTLPDERLPVRADGRLLWRVVENLLSNALKYSLPDSRVYISVFPTDNEAYIEVKNISAEELNIPADELMERFKRGDMSRSSEGSGLGLSIAKSLMLCQNGSLDINVDGDLFKATVRLPKQM